MSNSDGVEHLASVHNNPFVREFGTVASRQDSRGVGVRKSSVDSLTSADNDLEQEYHPNSGFVNKLRSKFNQLQNESGRKVTLSRKSASLENLLDSSSHSYGYKAQRHGSASHDDTKVHSMKDSVVELRRKPAPAIKTANRPRSNEQELRSSGKPPVLKKKETERTTPNHFIGGVSKPPLPKKKSNDLNSVRQSRNSASDSNKHKIEHHDWKVAPDLEKIGRDNIVIIESPSPSIRRKSDNSTSEQPKLEKTESLEKEDNRHVKPLKDKPVDENELPKPNTVSNFRSLFENTKKTSDVINVWRQSPTRTSAGSESPNVSSPAGTPRSPLVRMNDDNVFERSFKTEPSKEAEKDFSPRSSSSNDTISDKQSPRSPRNSTVEATQNVDTTSTSRQKSFDVFEKNTSDQQCGISVSASKLRSAGSYTESEDDSPASPKPLSPRLPSGLTPVHPISNVFDSTSLVKKDKLKKPKPAVIARRPNIPKDTIELKHEADKKKKPNLLKIDTTKASDNLSADTDADLGSSSIQTVKDTNVINSGRNGGKISPRKTKIFDSSSMAKKDRPSPTFSSSSPVDKQLRMSPVNDQPLPDNNTIKAQTEPSKPDVTKSEIKLNGDTVTPKPGLKPIKANRAAKAEPQSKTEQRVEKMKVPMVAQDEIKPEPVKPRSKPADNKTAPVSGMSSYLVNKLKKTAPDSSNQSEALTNGSSPSPIPRKRQAPNIPVVNGTSKVGERNEDSPPPLPVTPEPEIPKSNIDDIIKRKKKNVQVSSKMVFDSSNIVKKKKEVPKRKPPRKTIEELNKNIMSEPTVPLLDLSSITNDKPVTEYQEGYIPTEIRPCPFVFIGAEVVLEPSPYKKKKKNRVRLAFNDQATTTFEYEREDAALEAYLVDHPEEREEARRQEEEEELGLPPSTSPAHLLQDAPPPHEPDTMKSNTVIGMSSGALTNYKSKIQVQEFQFGMETAEQEVYVAPEDDGEQDDSMQLLPADDNDLDTFSAETGKADLLF